MRSLQFELAAKRAADEVTSPRPDGSAVHDIQIMLTSDQNPLLLRDLQVQYRAVPLVAHAPRRMEEWHCLMSRLPGTAV
jgi:hypothetical protein